VFTNLLSNALKFTPAGGRVTVEAQIVERSMEVRVSDNGAGISPEFLPYVFDRFRQGDHTTLRNRSGLGLGLSIAKRLVEAHQGTIVVESAGKDQGAAFVVRLPIVGATDRPADSPRSEPKALRPRLDGIRVLIVDDEADARDVMGQALGECGADIAMASGATDALDILAHADIDVLLADLAMPDEDGYSLIRRIRASSTRRLASIPAAAVTAHAGDHERQKALEAGFQVHVTKPIEPFDLARTVGELARR
jgi:CheY-like chemotaxis protein